jgi:hypothetical protein
MQHSGKRVRAVPGNNKLLITLVRRSLASLTLICVLTLSFFYLGTFSFLCLFDCKHAGEQIQGSDVLQDETFLLPSFDNRPLPSVWTMERLVGNLRQA